MPDKNTKEDEILESLSGLTEAVGSRFDKIDDRFGKLDQNVFELRGDMDSQFVGVREQLDRIEHSILEEHARRIEALERKIGITR